MAYKFVQEEPEEPIVSAESIHRLPAQAAKGPLALLPGIFGDVASVLNKGAGFVGEKVFGQKAVPYEQTPIGKALPTTATHMKNLEEGIPYLKPKNKVEHFVSDVTTDAASMFIPGVTLEKIGLRAGSALGNLATSLGANAGGEAVTSFTGDEQKGAYTKMGLMFLGSVLNKPGAQREVSNLYNKADQLLPPNATVNAGRLTTDMNSIRNRVLQGRQIGDLAPSERFVVDEADTILRQVQHGQVNVGTLKASLRSLNENLQRAVYEAPNQSTRVRARKLATQINRDVNRTLADYGKTNPEWWETQRSANQAFGTLQQSNFVTNFIRNNVQGNTVTHGLLHALGVTTGAAGAIVPYQSAKLLYRITNSPVLAKHYARVVSSAAAEDASSMNRELEKLDSALQKQEEKKSKKFRFLQ